MLRCEVLVLTLSAGAGACVWGRVSERVAAKARRDSKRTRARPRLGGCKGGALVTSYTTTATEESRM